MRSTQAPEVSQLQQGGGVSSLRWPAAAAVAVPVCQCAVQVHCADAICMTTLTSCVLSFIWKLYTWRWPGGLLKWVVDGSAVHAASCADYGSCALRCRSGLTAVLWLEASPAARWLAPGKNGAHVVVTCRQRGDRPQAVGTACRRCQASVAMARRPRTAAVETVKRENQVD